MRDKKVDYFFYDKIKPRDNFFKRFFIIILCTKINKRIIDYNREISRVILYVCWAISFLILIPRYYEICILFVFDYPTRLYFSALFDFYPYIYLLIFKLFNLIFNSRCWW